jgi:thiol-disulfide isomerase/thioredoxin
VNQIRTAKILSIIVLAILLTSLLTGCLDNSSKDTSSYGEDFEFVLLNSEEKHMGEYSGKIVLIDFMGVNCFYCVPQIFTLEEIYNNYSSDEVVLLSINVWIAYGETIQDVEDLKEAYRCSSPCEAEDKFSHLSIREFKENYGKQDGLDLNWDFGLDDQSGTLLNKYANIGVPTLYILDKNGNTYYSNAGFTEYSVLAEKLDELLK